MDRPVRKRWFGAAILIGVLYAGIGVTFALPTDHVRAWRLAAWAISAVLYAAHISYENFRLDDSPPVTALHVALAVALGAFGLAVSASIHHLFVASSYNRLFASALVIWPIITGVPSFIVALGVAYAFARIRQRS